MLQGMVSYNLTLVALVVFVGPCPGTGSCANSVSRPDWHLGEAVKVCILLDIPAVRLKPQLCIHCFGYVFFLRLKYKVLLRNLSFIQVAAVFKISLGLVCDMLVGFTTPAESAAYLGLQGEAGQRLC